MQYSGKPDLVITFSQDPVTGLEKPGLMPSVLESPSMFPATSFLGDPQRCLLGKGMKYCLLSASMDPPPPPGAGPQDNNDMGDIKLGALLGMCRPASCSSEDIQDKVQHIVDAMKLQDFSVSCHTLGDEDPVELTWGRVSFLVLAAFITVLMIVGTVASLRKSAGPTAGGAWPTAVGADQEASTEGAARQLLPNAPSSAAGGPTGSRFAWIPDAWSLLRNWESLRRIRQEDPEATITLAVLDGLRVLSTLWVILGHTIIWPMLSIAYDNPDMVLPPEGRLTKVWFQIVPGGYFAVDTFFWLSGFLGAFSLHQKVRRNVNLLTLKGFCLKLYPMALLSRWLRLSFIYAFLIAFSQTWFRVLGQNSLLWSAKMGIAGMDCIGSVENTNCQKEWWMNLLYVNNLISSTNDTGGAVPGGCFLHSWYLACDMQMFLILPVMVLIRERAGKNVSWAVLAFLTILSTAANLIIVSQNNMITDPVLGDFGGGHFTTQVYEASYTRAQPYLLGIGCAWMLDALRKSEVSRPSQAQQEDGVRLMPLSRVINMKSFLEMSPASRAAPLVQQGAGGLGLEAEQPGISSMTTEGSMLAGSRGPLLPMWIRLISRPAVALLLQLLSFAAMCFVVFIPVTRYRCSSILDCIHVDTAPWSPAMNLWYCALNHLVWGAGLGCILMMSFLRAPGTWWLNALLGHSAWQLPAKLSYAAYLIHPMVLVFFYCQADGSYHYLDSTFVLNFIAFSVIIFLCAAATWLTVEKPMANICAKCLSALGGGRSEDA